MRSVVVVIVLFIMGVAMTGLIQPAPPPPSPGVAAAIDYFKTEAPVFSTQCTALRDAIRSMDLHDSRSMVAVRRRLIDCRASYKKIEPFLEYFFRSSSRIYNRAPKFEAEEPGMEYQSPLGLQVIETLLFETNTPDRRQQLLQQSDAVASSASDLTALLYDLKADDRQILESLRIQLIRIITLGITGYDAPYLKTGISESRQSLIAIKYQLQPYLSAPASGSPGQLSDSLTRLLDNAISFCSTYPDFNTFDRVGFLKKIALPLQYQLGLLIRSRGLGLNTSQALNYDAHDLFSPDALRPEQFSGQTRPIALIIQGRQLFSDPSISGDHRHSCASCHDPEKKFTDGLTTPMAFDGHSSLERNAPTLLYAGLQYRQFWDGRALTLEDQIKAVLRDPKEMHTGDTTLTAITPIARAIAAYVETLHPMNSRFDTYIEGGSDTLLTRRQIRGANLFLGRAQCATCHFAPLFNGLIPPDYALTEFEALGTTRTDRFEKPQLSPDQGRYSVYPFPFFRGAFKTPTVRNTAATAPYMHNGAFRTLEKVLDFYNKGGGQGLGLDLPSQTLSSHPLGLTQTDMQDIILFLHALTDSLPPPTQYSASAPKKNS